MAYQDSVTPPATFEGTALVYSSWDVEVRRQPRLPLLGGSHWVGIDRQVGRPGAPAVIETWAETGVADRPGNQHKDSSPVQPTNLREYPGKSTRVMSQRDDVVIGQVQPD